MKLKIYEISSISRLLYHNGEPCVKPLYNMVVTYQQTNPGRGNTKYFVQNFYATTAGKLERMTKKLHLDQVVDVNKDEVQFVKKR